MKIVIDTNVLISGIFWKGPPYAILELWAAGDLEACATSRILKEYGAVLGRMDRDKRVTEQWKLFIAENATLVEDGGDIHLSRDKNDDMFLGCAVTAGADYIISGDNDLLALQGRFTPEIVTPTQFLRIWRDVQATTRAKSAGTSGK